MSDKARKTCGVTLLIMALVILISGSIPERQREPAVFRGQGITDFVIADLKELASDSLINTGDAGSLGNLPGIGPVTAEAIIKEREENGPFIFPEELVSVHGIVEAKMAQIRELLIADTGESEE